MSAILNISAYRFVCLPDAADWRDVIEHEAGVAELKGTVLLAEEGINLFLAGAPQRLRAWLDWLRQDSRFSDLAVKESWSELVPFRKLRVKIKREIIRMDHPSIRPERGRSPAVDAKTLARWLDAGHDDGGRPVLLLDTRNRFEVGHGKFRNAVDLQTSKFSELPAAALARRDMFDGKTVVSYCTGGIRCEKAAIFLAGAGVDRVFQLDGGILQYFEQVGARHFDGQCFVFDERIALTADLTPA
ncbi:MAG: sulfurtransferase [Ideonella sp.]